MAVDVTVENHGSVFLFHPCTEAGSDWIEDNVDPDAQWFGDALAVEHRYAGPLADGMLADGLAVE